MVEGPEWEIDDVVAETQEAMAEASAIVLDGFRLRSDAKIVRWPDRYMDDRGREFWGRVVTLLPEVPETMSSSDGLQFFGVDPNASCTGSDFLVALSTGILPAERTREEKEAHFDFPIVH